MGVRILFWRVFETEALSSVMTSHFKGKAFRHSSVTGYIYISGNRDKIYIFKPFLVNVLRKQGLKPMMRS